MGSGRSWPRLAMFAAFAGCIAFVVGVHGWVERYFLDEAPGNPARHYWWACMWQPVLLDHRLAVSVSEESSLQIQEEELNAGLTGEFGG